eukprot:SAG11_NODE_2230_length_3658_cov_2.411071_2_plen_250_part_00
MQGFSAYLGWVTVATILNFALASHSSGWDGTPWDEDGWACAVLAVAAVLALLVRHRCPPASQRVASGGGHVRGSAHLPPPPLSAAVRAQVLATRRDICYAAVYCWAVANILGRDADLNPLSPRVQGAAGALVGVVRAAQPRPPGAPVRSGCGGGAVLRQVGAMTCIVAAEHALRLLDLGTNGCALLLPHGRRGRRGSLNQDGGARRPPPAAPSRRVAPIAHRNCKSVRRRLPSPELFAARSIWRARCRW